jgi:hypothetical protein
MKKIKSSVLAAMLIPVFAACSFAEDMKINGVWYRNAKWGPATPLEVSLFHKEGVTRFPLAMLSPELQQQFGYDPVKAAAYLEEQDKKWKEERVQNEDSSQAQNAPGQEEVISSAVVDGNNFYLKRGVLKTLYGPFTCESGTVFSIEKNNYEIVRATNLLFAVKSALTKNILGPFWLKDEADMVLDGINFKLLRPTTVVKEQEKIRDEHDLITATQASQAPTQQVLESKTSLQSTGTSGMKKQGLGSGVGTNETLKRKTGL